MLSTLPAEHYAKSDKSKIAELTHKGLANPEQRPGFEANEGT